MAFSYETNGNNTFLVYGIQPEDSLDTMTLGMITNNRIPGLASVLYTQMNMERFLKYNITAKVTVKQFFAGVVNKRRLLGVFSGITAALSVAEEYMIDLNSLLLDTDFIYADVTTCNAEVICLPVTNVAGVTDISMFFKNIMFTTQFDQTENCDYVARIINYLNSAPIFVPSDFGQLLEQLLAEGSGQNSYAQPHSYAQPIPMQQPQVQEPAKKGLFGRKPEDAGTQPLQQAQPQMQQPVQSQANQFAQPQPQPVQPQANQFGQPQGTPQQPVQPPKKVEKQGNLGFAMPGQNPNPGFAMPGQNPNPGFAVPGKNPNPGFPVPDQNAGGGGGSFGQPVLLNQNEGKKQKGKSKQPTEKGMSMFYLLQHYNKENAALYKEQKNAKKSTGKADLNVPQSDAFGAQGKKDNGFAVPGQNNGAGFAMPGQNKGAGFGMPGQNKGAGFAMPGQNNGAGFAAPGQNNGAGFGMPGQNNGAGFQVPGQNNGAGFGMPGQPASQPQVQKQQPATPPQQPVQQPASYAAPPQPMPMDDNFGGTVIMGVESYGDDTVVLGAAQAAAVKPYLLRSSNNEKILLEKAVFHIGKERSYVDYCISGNPTISRSHADIINKNGQFYIKDNNSTNHTYVNGEMIPSSTEIPLTHGAKIRLSNEEFEFRTF